MTISVKRGQESRVSPKCVPVLLQIACILTAGFCLYYSRIETIAIIPAIFLLGMAVFLAFHSPYKLFSTLLIALFTSVILSLRFDFLTWGDPWFEYGMIQRIILFQSLNPSIYIAQFPVLHVNITAISIFSNIDPLTLQKFIIPPLSVLAIFAVYKLTEDISSSDTPLYAGLLLLSATPYLHWTTQGVRETLGLALSILALYICIKTIRYENFKYLILSLLLVTGVVFTHHLSTGIFLVSWLAVSFTFLYLVCDISKIQKTCMFCLIITVYSVIVTASWWNFKQGFEFLQFNGLLNTIYHSDNGIPLFLITLIIIYCIPVIIPQKIHHLQLVFVQILKKKKMIFFVYCIVILISGLFVMSYLSGRSRFVLTYPLPMLFNGFFIGIFSLIGVFFFLERERLPVLAWVAALMLILIFSLSGIIQLEDNIRIIEFLFMPLCILAAFGITRIEIFIASRAIFSIAFTVFIIISIIAAFPSVVFLGQSFERGHPLYDNRSLVIQHKSSEISAITWLEKSGIRGIVDTDTYVGYAARGIILNGNDLNIHSAYPFTRDTGYPQRTDFSVQQHALLILSRMSEYTEFGIQWLKEKNPLSVSDLQRINNECNLLYSNGDAKIYSYYSNITSEYYYYNSLSN